MLKIIFTTLLFISSFSIAVRASDNTSIADNFSNFDEDYFVGLKAFEDGFNDVAASSLKEYLKNAPASKQVGFANYLLYQIYLAAGDYTNAKAKMAETIKYDDARFDKLKISNDKMFIETKLDCVSANKLLMSDVNNEWVKIYSASVCPIDGKLAQYVAKNDFNEDSLYFVIEKIKSNKNIILDIYQNLPKEKKSNKLMNFYGHFFALEKMRKEFWALYNEYKDADLVSLALSDIWDAADYSKYVDIFANDVKSDYKLESALYCRMIESSNKVGKTFACGIVDGCLGEKHPDFKKTKLACYVKNEDKAGLSSFMKSVSAKEAANMCDYGKYIVGKGLYNINFIDKFAGCSDKTQMYESLITQKDDKALAKLASASQNEEDIAYMAIANHMGGKTADFENYKNKLQDKKYLDLVKKHTGE